MIDWLNIGQRTYRRFFTTDFRQLLGDSSWTYASTIINLGLQLAETVIIARFLTIDLYGVFILITAFPEAVLQLLDFRVREAMTKYLTEFIVREEKPQAVALIKLLWLLDTGTGLLAFLIVSLTVSLAATWLKLDASTMPLMIIYSLGLMIASFDSASGSILRVFNRFDWAFWLSSAGHIVRFALVLTAVIWGRSLEAIVWSRAIAELVMTGLLGAASLRLLHQHLWLYRHSGLRVLQNQMHEITRFIFHTNFAATFKMLTLKLDVLILGFFWPASVVGIYKMAAKFSGLLLLVSDPLSVAILPNFTRQYATKGFQGLIKLSWRTSLMIAPVAGLGILILGGATRPLIMLTVGESFLPAIGPLRIMLVGIIVNVIFVWIRPTIVVMGRADVLNLIGFVASIVQLVLLWFLVPYWGVWAGAVSLAAQFTTYVLAELLFLWRTYNRYTHSTGVSL